MATPETKVLEKCYPDLVKCIEIAPTDVAVKVRPHGLLSPKDFIYINNDNRDRDDKAIRLLDSVSNQVLINKESFHLFVSALKEAGTFTKSAVALLEATYKDISNPSFCADDLNVKELPPDSASKSPTASQPHAAACKIEEMQMFCTADDEKLEQVDPSNIPTDAQGGVARLHLLWDVEQIPELKIHFLNPDILEDEHWKCGHAGPLTVDTILAWAAVWNSHADNYPQIAEGLATKEKAHIRVEFRRKGISWSKVGTTATWQSDKKKPTMVLNLYGMTKADQRSMVIHEFGHALGLDHEHQRSDFWDVLESKDEDEEYRFIIGKRRMKSGNGGRCQRACDAVFRAKLKEPSGRKESCYDSDSIMHYWFDKNWLLPEYHKSANVAKVRNERERKVLFGVHKRDYHNGNLAEKPSKLDYETLNRAYEKPSGLPGPPDAAAAPPTLTTAQYTKPEVQTEATAAQLSQQCSNDALIQLSTEIADYNGFKVRLGLSDAEINAIDQTPATINDIQGRFLTALKTWQSTGMLETPATCTYGRLMDIARNKKDGFAFKSIQRACIKYAGC
ncbi:uncharacterized protein LOC135335838 [Halichondria panicea]|uniref:uncharacterized protein LOC135335838 n=1 Tax=Halichondria panicea TaxID=6063 RepID=UPI00312BB174